MTKKAIDLLSQDPDGFFLMVEGSQVDWAGHANDPAYMTFDFLAFDGAVNAAVKFAEKDGNTLVLVFPDHNTGALSLGHEQSTFPPSYTATTIEDVINPIKDSRVSWQALMYLIPANSIPAVVRQIFVDYLGSYWSMMTDEMAQYISDMITEQGPANAYYQSTRIQSESRRLGANRS